MIGPIPYLEYVDTVVLPPHVYSHNFAAGQEAFKLNKHRDTNPHEPGMIYMAWEQGWVAAAKEKARSNYIAAHALRLKAPDRLRTSVFLHGMGTPSLISVLVDQRVYDSRREAEHLIVLNDVLIMLCPNARINLVKFAKGMVVRSAPSVDELRGFATKASPAQGAVRIKPVLNLLDKKEGDGENNSVRRARATFEKVGYPRVGEDAGSPVIIMADSSQMSAPGSFSDLSFFDLLRMRPDVYLIVTDH